MKKVYGYSYLQFNKDFTLTAGASLESFQRGMLEAKLVNPKLGISWILNPTTTLRAAGFRTLRA